MKKLIALAALLVSPAARAQQVDTPFILHDYVHHLIGAGGAPNISTPFFVTTLEIGRHPFRSIRDSRTITFGAFSAGASISFGADPGGKLLYVGGGLRLALDLTYIFLSGLWSTVDFDQCFPFHITLGERLTIAYTDARGVYPAYDLARVEAETTLDLEIPFGARRQHALIFRAAIDSSVALDATFRMTGQIGYGFSWERP